MCAILYFVCNQQSYRGKQLHQLLYKRKVKQIQDFTHCQYFLSSFSIFWFFLCFFLHFIRLVLILFLNLRRKSVPVPFRNDLEEAGWTVGRSPIHKSVTAADGTIKVLIPHFYFLPPSGIKIATYFLCWLVILPYFKYNCYSKMH